MLNIKKLAEWHEEPYELEPKPRTWTKANFSRWDRELEDIYIRLTLRIPRWRNTSEFDEIVTYRKVASWYSDYVAVWGNHQDETHRRMTPLDEDGECLIRVEISEIEHFYNEHYVAQAEAASDADNEIMGWAN